jgi:thioredoxin
LTATPLIASDGNFSDLVELSPLPVLVDFWAAWCGPCRIIAPVVDELAREFTGRLRIAKLNVDDNPLVASRFGVRSIPTLIIFQGGREVDRIVGAAQKAQIVQRLTRFL